MQQTHFTSPTQAITSHFTGLNSCASLKKSIQPQQLPLGQTMGLPNQRCAEQHPLLCRHYAANALHFTYTGHYLPLYRPQQLCLSQEINPTTTIAPGPDNGTAKPTVCRTTPTVVRTRCCFYQEEKAGRRLMNQALKYRRNFGGDVRPGWSSQRTLQKCSAFQWPLGTIQF